MKIFSGFFSLLKKIILANFIVFGSIFGNQIKERNDPVKKRIEEDK